MKRSFFLLPEIAKNVKIYYMKTAVKKVKPSFWGSQNSLLLLIILAVVIFSFGIAFLSPLKALSLLVGLGFLFVAFYDPKYIVLFLAIYTPFEPFLLKFIPDEIYFYSRYTLEGLIYVLLISVGTHLLLRRNKLLATPIDWPFAVFLFICFASIVINLVPWQIGFLGVRQIIRFILLFYIVANLGLDKKFIKKIIYLLFAIVLVEVSIGYLQAIIGSAADQFLLPSRQRFLSGFQITTSIERLGEAGVRIFATLGRYDQLGTFLVFFLLLIVGLLYEIKNLKEKKILFALLLFSLPVLILTYSRASWFGFLLGFLLIGLAIKRNKYILYSLICFVLLMVSYVFYSDIIVSRLADQPRPSVVERFFEAFSYERWRGEYLGYGRLYFIVKTPTVVVKHSPLFGVGPGQYGGGAVTALHNVTKYDELGLPFGVYGTEGYIDNNWLSLWGETGTFGLLAYLAIFGMLGKFAYRSYKKSEDEFSRGLALGFLGCLLALAFQAFLGTYLEVRTIALYFWLFGGIIVWQGSREYRQAKTKNI